MFGCGSFVRPPSARRPVNNAAVGSTTVAHWDHALADRLVRAVVAGQFQLGRFKHYPDQDVDSVTADLLGWAFSEFAKFDPARAGFSTWIHQFASARVHNVHRDRGRVAHREAVYASGGEYAGEYAKASTSLRDLGGETRRVPVVMPDEVLEPEAAEPETFEGEIVTSRSEPGPTFAETLGAFVRHARRMTQDASRQGRTYDPAQQLAVGAFAKHLKTSVRGTRGIFLERADLCRIVGFVTVPSYGWFFYATRSLTK